MTESYRMNCPNCGVGHRVVPAQAGQVLVCACGQQITLPPLREVRTLPPAEDDLPAQTTSPAAWDIPKMIRLIGIFVVLAGMALAAVFWVTWPRPFPVKRMTPVQTWDLWQRFQQQGLPQRYIRNDPFVAEMQARRLWLIFGGVLCLLGVGLILSARWIPRALQELPPEPHETDMPFQEEPGAGNHIEESGRWDSSTGLSPAP
jgi:hypothetical protein